MTRTAFRWGIVFVAVHTALLVLLAPSAFLYYGEGFLLSSPNASGLQKILDTPAHGLVYDIVNYRLPPNVHAWVMRRTSSLDEASLVYSFTAYSIIGGAFYFIVGSVAGTIRALLKGREARVA
jgi:hypothetical protein